jgi:23S rRNA pseudouridine2605 synthase
MPNEQEPERLQKLLSRLGVASRREAEQWIRAGRLSINGRAAALGDRVDAGDQLRLDGRLIRQTGPARELPVLLCHRSPGLPLLSTPANADSFASHLPRRTGPRFMSISPLPQVDGGLELLTADGALAVRLQRAMRAQPVVYSLRVRGELGAEQRAGVLGGQLDRGSTLRVIRVDAAGGSGSNQWYQIETIGASGNDLRQLLERQGVAVSRLMRVRLGSVQLERSMPRGRWRELLPAEIDSLLKPARAASSAADNPDSAR